MRGWSGYPEGWAPSGKEGVSAMGLAPWVGAWGEQGLQWFLLGTRAQAVGLWGWSPLWLQGVAGRVTSLTSVTRFLVHKLGGSEGGTAPGGAHWLHWKSASQVCVSLRSCDQACVHVHVCV